MAKVVSKIEIVQTRTKGELSVIQVCESALDDSWYIFYEPLIGEYRPDIVLFSGLYGAVILEVKDFTKSSISYFSHDVWHLNNENNKTVKSPLRQVNEYTYSLINLLETRTSLLQEVGRYKGKLRFPVLNAVVFPKLRKDQIIELGIQLVIPDDLIIAMDELSGGVLEHKIISLFNKSFYIEPLNESLVNDVLNLIYPEITVMLPSDTCTRFWSEATIIPFIDVVDEILYVATEARSLLRNKLPVEDIVVFVIRDRPIRLKTQKNSLLLTDVIRKLFYDMNVDERIKIMPINLFERSSAEHVFILDCNSAKGHLDSEIQLEETLRINKRRFVYTTTRSSGL
ncbi:nuclease-related domain-containing protein [Paenibacillus elgii]